MRRKLFVAVVFGLTLCLGSMAYADFTPISKGDSGEAVMEVQQLLKDAGYLDGNADGIFGNGTYEAVSAFQKDKGLEVTGVVGEETYNALTSKDSNAEQTADSDEAAPEADQTEGDTGVPVTVTVKAAEDELKSGPNVVILESDSVLSITKAGYSLHNDYLYYAVMLHNSSEDQAIRFPSFRITARSEDNRILGTEEQVVSEIYPGQDFVFGSMGFDVSEEPAFVEFEVIEDENDLVNPSALDYSGFKPLIVENTSYVSDEFFPSVVGEVVNPNDFDIDSVLLVVVFKDESGAIVCGDSSYADGLKAGKSIPFEIDIMSDVAFDSFEVFANVWS